ncbi:MAG: DEAD/DEAH box helicase, partial [Mariprofundus sp.]|nr:DEAD/DEAH box helicase [Mariprofundus sp.]
MSAASTISATQQTSHHVTYVEIAVFAPLAGTFTYLWPDYLGKTITGIRVQVPFGKGKRIGVVINYVTAEPDHENKYKSVLDRLDDSPLLDQARTKWLNRVGRYYLAQPGELWASALGWAAQHDTRRFRCPEPTTLNQQSELLTKLFQTRAAISLKTVLQRCDDSPGMRHLISQSCASGLIEEVVHDPLWVKKGQACGNTPPPKATDAQHTAITSITASLDKFQAFLLFGCTGSGKTEVYLKAAQTVIASGGQVLVLVPEIGLTPLWLMRLRERFKQVALWHSAMTTKERLQVRQHLQDTDILIGTRSALFLPLPKLALIVVDEEHDASFKQQEGMSYSARDMGVLL